MDRALSWFRRLAVGYEMREGADWNGELTNKQIHLQWELEKQQDAMTSVIASLNKHGEGVYVIASTFMSLKGLVECLTSPEVAIPVSALGVGPVTPGDIFKARKLQFATVLAFQVKLTLKARQVAEALEVKVICGDSIEQLCRLFREYTTSGSELLREDRAVSDEAVLPCVLSMLPKCVLNKEDPILVGVYVVEGSVRVGTPLCIPDKAFINIGRVAWIDKDQQPVKVASQGDKVIIKIVAADPKTKQLMLGREFDVGDVLVSRIPRRSIYHLAHVKIPS